MCLFFTKLKYNHNYITVGKSLYLKQTEENILNIQSNSQRIYFHLNITSRRENEAYKSSLGTLQSHISRGNCRRYSRSFYAVIIFNAHRLNRTVQLIIAHILDKMSSNGD